MINKNLESFIYETPLMYDEPTEKKRGKLDIGTWTKWGEVPPKDIPLDKLKRWVETRVKHGIIKRVSPDKLSPGKGISRIVFINDKNTVFKWNYDVTSATKNQTERENELYNKWKDTYAIYLPTMYMNGTHWSIQERAKVLDNPELVKLFLPKKTKKPFNYQEFYEKYKWFNIHLVQKQLIDLNEYYKCKTYRECEDYINSKISTSLQGFYDEFIHSFLHDKRIKEIELFANDVGLIWDLKLANLGLIGNRVVVIDYGATKETGT